MHGSPLPESLDKGETPCQSGDFTLCPSADGKDTPDTVIETRSCTFWPMEVDPEKQTRHFIRDAFKQLMSPTGGQRSVAQPCVPPEPTDHRSGGRLL